MNFFQILLYVLLAYMVMNMFAQSKRAGKESALVSLVKLIDEKDEFFERVNTLIEGAQSDVMANKFKVLRLWGDAYHGVFDAFDNDLKDIDFDLLVHDGDIGENEDSFLYLYITIPFLLHQRGRDDLRSVIREKMNAYDDVTKGQMLPLLASAADKFFLQEGDLGEATFRMIWEGDYAGMKYNKQLISVYKGICAACLAWIARENDREEEYTDFMSCLDSFSTGSKWIRALDLKEEDDAPEEEEIVDRVTEVVEEDKEEGGQ